MFSAYLWGIETRYFLLSIPIRCVVLSLPMRNWNSLRVRTTVPSSRVLSLPMRNWNIIICDPESKNGTVLSLPMRNWNGCYSGSCSFPLGSQPTYEELKPFLKGLKPLHYNMFSAYLWGIETPLGGAAWSGLTAVLSLPMRNWNFYFPWDLVKS